MVPAAALALHGNWSTTIAGNMGVAYIKPGQIEVRQIDYPTFELIDGAGGQSGQRGPRNPTRRDPQMHCYKISAAATNSWYAAAPPHQSA